jgi:hypothetical protein
MKKTLKSSAKKDVDGRMDTGNSDESILDFQYVNIELSKDLIWIDGMFLGPISYKNGVNNAKE